MKTLWLSCRNWVLISFLVFAFVDAATVVPCTVWDHDEPIEIADGIGLVSGLSLKYHPRNPRTGLIDYETYLAWTVGKFEETCHQSMQDEEPSCAQSQMWTKCDNQENYPSVREFAIFRAMDPGELNCYKERGHRLLNGYINQTYVTVEARWPDFPNFRLTFEVQAVSHNYTEDMGSGPQTDGYEYRINHVPNEIKSIIRVVNWPWGGPDNVTFVNAGFLGAARSAEGNATLNMTVGMEGSQLLLKTSRFLVKQEMTHFVSIDGQPVLKTWDSSIYRNFAIGNENPISFYLPFSICRDNGTEYLPHFDELEYDPQFSSLFLGEDGFQPELSPKQKSKSNAAAIAAGTSVGVVLLVVAGIALYFVLRPGPESYSKSSLNKKNEPLSSSTTTTQ